MIVIQFDDSFTKITAEQFIEEILTPASAPKRCRSEITSARPEGEGHAGNAGRQARVQDPGRALVEVDGEAVSRRGFAPWSQWGHGAGQTLPGSPLHGRGARS